MTSIAPAQPRAGSKRARANFVADFETSTGAWGEDGSRVWVWGLTPVDAPEAFEWGIDLESFIERLQQYNTITHFHNLKFDGWFIMDYLLKHDYVHTTERNAAPGEFKSLISDTNKVYSITIRWTNGHTTELRDTLKKFPNMSVAKIAKTFHLEEGKGDLDYDTPRPIGYYPTDEELDYVRRDVQIIAYALQEAIANGMTKLTIASDALTEYKSIVGEKWFSRTFPVLSEHMDAEIRRAYRGGFTYADERFRGRRLRSGIVLDVNSLYPSVMYNRALPYGEPEYVPGYVQETPQRPLTIFSVTFTARIKPEHIPCIQIKGHSIFGGTEYLTEIEDPVTLMVTNVDWALYNDHYDIEVLAYGGGWRFFAAEGMFDSYIDKWMSVKAASTGGQREIAKMYLNSLYGKFGSNPNVTCKIPTLKDEAVRLVRGEDETRAPIYTAMAVFITAFARDLTIRAAQQNYDTFAYADTDSLHLLQDEAPDTIEVHPSKLGAWKHEYNFSEAMFIRAKFYIEHTVTPTCGDKIHEHEDGCHWHNAIAGVPTKVSEKLRFDDLYEGNILHGKLSPKSVPGGIVLEPVPWEMKL